MNPSDILQDSWIIKCRFCGRQREVDSSLLTSLAEKLAVSVTDLDDPLFPLPMHEHRFVCSACGKKDAQLILKSSSKDVASVSARARDAGSIVFSWGNKQISDGYLLLSQGLSSATSLSKAASEAILKHVSHTRESAAKSGKRVVDGTAMFVNALLASDLSKSVESWLGHMFNEGVPSTYDKAVDAVFNATHIGGGHLHRLFDESHSVFSMWEKIRDATPDDNLLQELVGYASTLGKDLSSAVGIPLFDWSKSSYETVAGALNNTFGIPKSWVADLQTINALELFGSTIGTIAVLLNWNKEQVSEFASLASSLGVSSIYSANPALVIVTLAALAKSYSDAKQKGDFSEFLAGLIKGGIGTGIVLATAAVIGGPAWIGLVAGTCIGAVVQTKMDDVRISEIGKFVEGFVKGAMAEPELEEFEYSMDMR